MRMMQLSEHPYYRYLLAALLALVVIFAVHSLTGDFLASSDLVDTLLSQAVGSTIGLKPRPCVGPRGLLLDDSPDDRIHSFELDGDFPTPMGGSYEELGLEKTWYSASSRYGPYGYGEHSGKSQRRKVDWDTVDWGALQDACLATNNHRFSPPPSNFSTKTRFIPREAQDASLHVPPLRSPSDKTGRTAFVFRTWSTFGYLPEDFWNLRSTIQELALESGGEYGVYLLVDMHSEDRTLLNMTTEEQETLLKEIVPREFQSMTVLWDQDLLANWYKISQQHDPVHQMFQPLQLFAHFYPEYDHYWEWEMDARFTGHAGRYLSSVDTWSRQQPRKQSIERSSYAYMESLHGPYSNFTTHIDSAVSGGGHWGPLRIPELQAPIGPAPPTPIPEDDDFRWGVGEDADVVTMTKVCINVTNHTPWIYGKYIFGFSSPSTLPRLNCPPAAHRGSWNLLNAIHDAQMTQGLRVASEATLPSFALWHGMKLARPPNPWYMDKQSTRSHSQIENLWNGGPIGAHGNISAGMGWPDFEYNRKPYGNLNGLLYGTTWHFLSNLVPRMMRFWFSDEHFEMGKAVRDMPQFMRINEHGEACVPNMIVHPRKSRNKKGQPSLVLSYDDEDEGEGVA